MKKRSADLKGRNCNTVRNQWVSIQAAIVPSQIRHFNCPAWGFFLSIHMPKKSVEFRAFKTVGASRVGGIGRVDFLSQIVLGWSPDWSVSVCCPWTDLCCPPQISLFYLFINLFFLGFFFNIYKKFFIKTSAILFFCCSFFGESAKLRSALFGLRGKWKWERKWHIYSLLPPFFVNIFCFLD